MKYLLIALLGLNLVACATTSNYKEPELIISEDDQTIDPYLALFKIEAEKRNVPVNYPFGLQIRLAKNLTVLTGAEGRCYPGGDKLIVQLDKHLWDNAPHLVREQLMFHELGHCIFGLNHDNTTDEYNRRYSIMHETGVYPGEYARNREFFLDKFFGKVRTKMQKVLMFFQNNVEKGNDDMPSLLDILDEKEQDPEVELNDELNNTNL